MTDPAVRAGHVASEPPLVRTGSARIPGSTVMGGLGGLGGPRAYGTDPALGAGSPTGGGEDTAAFSDAILRGGRLVYEPRSLCWHEHRRDVDALRGQLFNYGVGFTATLCRAASHDPRFARSAVQAIPTVAKLLYRRARAGSEESEGHLPAELSRLEYAGMMRGPLLYVKSVRRVSRLGLNDRLELQKTGT